MLKSLVLGLGILAAAVSWAGRSAPETAESSVDVNDDFEAPKLDPKRWWVGRAVEGKYWIDTSIARSGRSSLAIQVTPAERDCEPACQRNEIRIASALRQKFGEEAWYSFSFRIEGDLLVDGNTRWVSGQWKQETDDSPFLAQRFSRGVFHITVEDRQCRVVVARAGGAADGSNITHAGGSLEQGAVPAEERRDQCHADIAVEHSPDPVLPNPYGNWVDMTYRVRGGRNGTGLIEIWANNRFIARVRGSIGSEKVAGPTQYFKFGVYRDLMPGTATVYLDNFRRSSTRD